MNQYITKLQQPCSKVWPHSQPALAISLNRCESFLGHNRLICLSNWDLLQPFLKENRKTLEMLAHHIGEMDHMAEATRS